MSSNRRPGDESWMRGGGRPTVAVIGAGPGGIAMGCPTRRGMVMNSRSSIGADGFGGTWRKNTYPGAACDVPSHFYSFSFALNPRWSKTYANQPEILAYLERVAAERGLERPPPGEHRGDVPALVGHRSAVDRVTTDDGGRARVRHGRERRWHARRAKRPRHRRVQIVFAAAPVPLLAVGPREVVGR